MGQETQPTSIYNVLQVRSTGAWGFLNAFRLVLNTGSSRVDDMPRDVPIEGETPCTPHCEIAELSYRVALRW